MRLVRIDDRSLPLATELINSEWGEESAGDFEVQWRNCRLGCGAAIGCFNGTDIVGVGLVSESEISFGVWGLSWCVVAPEFRRQGIARMLIEAREQFVAQASREGKKTLVQVVTSFSQLFEPLGYRKVWSWDDASLMVKYLSDFK